MTIHEKLMMIQSELKAPKSKRNSFGNYNYRSCEDILEAVKPLLKKNGCTLRMSDTILPVESRVYVVAEATLTDVEKGESLTVKAMAREPDAKKGMDDSQITGTASSYARKYALNGMFAIDDTKDADTDEYQAQQEKPAPRSPAPKAAPKNICKRCGKEILGATFNGKNYTPAAIIERSKKSFGVPLCWECCLAKSKEA